MLTEVMTGVMGWRVVNAHYTPQRGCLSVMPSGIPMRWQGDLDYSGIHLCRQREEEQHWALLETTTVRHAQRL